MTTTSKATCTGLSKVLDNAYSHDSFTRLLSGSNFDSKFLWQEGKVYVRELSSSNILKVLVLDDSLQEKLWTDESELVCWHFDHSKQRRVHTTQIDPSSPFQIDPQPLLKKRASWVPKNMVKN